ncbi:MAG: CBS domain-containing protein [Thermoanaerobaculia bacterium]|jgi:CBS domain-containing protein
MKTLMNLISAKGSEVYSIGPGASVLDAVGTMDAKRVGALLVMEGTHLEGIVSERDVARKVILGGKDASTMPVREIMTARVVCGRPDLKIDEAMAIMTDKRIRHLPVADGSRVVGVISIGDLVKAMIEEQQFLIAQLEHYITS